MSLAERLRAALARSIATAPLTADDFDPEPDAPPPVPAAVLVAAVDRPEPGLLLTLRHQGLRAHAGQIAFPGGRIDPGDPDAVAAALREAEEEIALPQACVEIVGLLDRFETVTGYLVQPALGVVPPDLPLRPRAGEVEEWFETPLRHLLDPANREEKVILFRGRERRYYEIKWRERRVWGATAAMIVNLAARLGRDW